MVTMNPQSQNNPASDVASASGVADELPATHPPSAFRAPAQTSSHYDMPVATQAAAPVAPNPIVSLAAAVPERHIESPKSKPTSAVDMLAEYNAPPDTRSEVAADDVDTAFDEEWVLKAQGLVGHTKGDPFMQSQEMSKLKAAYIKARYNKSIKVGE